LGPDFFLLRSLSLSLSLSQALCLNFLSIFVAMLSVTKKRRTQYYLFASTSSRKFMDKDGIFNLFQDLAGSAPDGFTQRVLTFFTTPTIEQS
jgi:hypothetical protein